MKKTIFSVLLSLLLLSASAAAEEPENIQAPKGKGLIERGYKGNVSIGSDFLIEERGYNFFTIMTSHGYQFNPYFWLGGGLGASYGIVANPIPVNFTLTAFAQVRATPVNYRISPIIDAKIGGVSYAIGNLSAVLASPSVGVRFGFRKCALNLLADYNYQLLIFKDNHDLDHMHNIGIKLEIEW